MVAHNDPSPARERVLRLFEERHIALNMVISLPSLDGIKRAVELKLGVALLPRRCAITEIASGRLVAVPVAGISRRRQVTLVCRKAHRSHAANAFLAVAQEKGANRPDGNKRYTQSAIANRNGNLDPEARWIRVSGITAQNPLT